MADRPLTQKELQKQQKSKASEPILTVTNISRKALITLHLREHGSDFYVGERSVRLKAGQSFTDRVSLFNDNQLSNLAARGAISIIR